MSHRRLSVVVVSLLGSCATTPNDLAWPQPVPAEEWFAVDYHGAVGPTEGLTEAETVPALAPAGAAAGLAPLLVEVSLWKVDAACARALLRDGATAIEATLHDGCGAIGGRVKASDVEAAMADLVKSGRASVVQEPRFNCDPGRLTTASIVESTAYVRGFELRSRPSALMSDPVIDTARAGVVWWIHCDHASTAARAEIDVNVGMTLVEKIDPIAVTGFRLQHSPEISLQTPLLCRQRVNAKATLAGDQGLLLGGLLCVGEDARYVALLTASSEKAGASVQVR